MKSVRSTKIVKGNKMNGIMPLKKPQHSLPPIRVPSIMEENAHDLFNSPIDAVVRQIARQAEAILNRSVRPKGGHLK